MFEYTGVNGVMLDLSTLGIEFQIKFMKTDNTSYGVADHVMPVNHLSNSLFKSAHVCIDD